MQSKKIPNRRTSGHFWKKADLESLSLTAKILQWIILMLYLFSVDGISSPDSEWANLVKKYISANCCSDLSKPYLTG